MPLESREPTSFDLLPTPHVGSRVVRLWVRQEHLREGVTITEGQTVTSFLSAIQVATSDVLSAGFGSYVLTEPGPVREGGYLSFHFTQATADLRLKKLTPWSEKTIWDSDFMWPDVLRYLYAVEGRAADLTREQSGVADILETKLLQVDRYELVQGGRIPTQVIVRRYLTSGPMTGLVAERPQPQPVVYSWKGLSNSLNCLHDDIIVPELLQVARVIDRFGTANAPDIAQLGEQLFPRTNFLTWRSHIYRIEQSDRPVNGYYETVTYEALPPPMPQGQLLGS